MPTLHPFLEIKGGTSDFGDLVGRQLGGDLD
jgi:hypothetical protein